MNRLLFYVHLLIYLDKDDTFLQTLLLLIFNPDSIKVLGTWSKFRKVDALLMRFSILKFCAAFKSNKLSANVRIPGRITFSILSSLPAYFSRISNGFFALELSRSALRSLATEPLLPSKGLKSLQSNLQNPLIHFAFFATIPVVFSHFLHIFSILSPAHCSQSFHSSSPYPRLFYPPFQPVRLSPPSSSQGVSLYFESLNRFPLTFR